MEEFKKFLSKGNVVEIAVGLIMATYFGAIAKSLVDDILMPPIGVLLGDVDFTELKIILVQGIAESAIGKGDGIAEVAINYGLFLNTILTFVIVSFAVFMIVKSYNRLKDKMEKKEMENTPPPSPTKEEILLTEIRDLLKENKK